MPTIHLGVYLTSGKETYQAIRWALEVCFLLFLAYIPYANNADTGRLDIAGKFIVSTLASV
jgi:hypothetical protein